MTNPQSIFLKRTADGSIRVDVRDSDQYTNLIQLLITTSVNDEYRHEVREGTPMNLFLTPAELLELTKVLARSQDLLVMPAFELQDIQNAMENGPDTLPSDVNPQITFGKFQGFGHFE